MVPQHKNLFNGNMCLRQHEAFHCSSSKCTQIGLSISQAAAVNIEAGSRRQKCVSIKRGRFRQSQAATDKLSQAIADDVAGR